MSLSLWIDTDEAMAPAAVFDPPEKMIVLIDPLQRLFDPTFTDVLWEYEHSRVGLLPGKLHAKQLEMLTDHASHRHLFWGNQVGKSLFGAVDMVLSALGRHPLQIMGARRLPPFTGWASALSWELWEKILLPELLTWIPPWRIIDAPQPFTHSTKRDIVIRADNGKVSRITGKAAEQGPDKYQSARVDKVWLDEEHPEAVWDEIQPRLLRYGGTTLSSMTPLKGVTTFIFGRIYEPIRTGQITKERHSFSHAGIRDNPGITPEARAEMLEELKHNPAQLAARDEGKFVKPFGAVLPWDPELHQVVVTKEMRDRWKTHTVWFGSIDLGKWGFAFTFGPVDHEGILTLVDEVFSQNESTDLRAKRLHDVMKLWEVPDLINIPADCADPVGIDELNAAFARINSPYRCYPIAGELKKKTTGIERVVGMLNRGALKVRKGMGQDHQWYLGKDASRPGKPVMGSRWMWEATSWVYPTAPDGKVQKDEPDDASADGAHMMDSLRYLVADYYAANAPKPPFKHPTVAERVWKELAALDKPNTGYRGPPALRQG